MIPKASTHYEFMLRCLEGAASAACEHDRQTLLAMASSFERGDIQLQKSLLMIAESWELLWRLGEDDRLRRKPTIPEAEKRTSLRDTEPSPPA
jgi:hypothetical protein